MKCKQVCHQNCSVTFNENSAVLTSCWINDKGKCRVCGCVTSDHMHARIEFFKEKEETQEYKLLKARIASEKAKADGNLETVDFYYLQVDQMQKDILNLQKKIQEAIQDYGKQCLGPGLLKLQK